MRAVIQRVKKADVKINKEIVGEINQGLLILLAIHKNDTADKIKKMADKILNLRIFSDENEKMNLSIKDVSGELLVVSQFTLYGDCSKGKRPSFMDSTKPIKAIPYYEKFIDRMKSSGLKVATGKFGAMMDVNLINNGPVTIIIED